MAPSRCSLSPDRIPRHQEWRPEGHSRSPRYDLGSFRTCSSPSSAPILTGEMGGRHPQGAGIVSTCGRPIPAGPSRAIRSSSPASRQAGSAHVAIAGHDVRIVDEGCRYWLLTRHGLDRHQADAGRRPSLPTLLPHDDRMRGGYSPSFRAATRPPTPLQGRYCYLYSRCAAPTTHQCRRPPSPTGGWRRCLSSPRMSPDFSVIGGRRLKGEVPLRLHRAQGRVQPSAHRDRE